MPLVNATARTLQLKIVYYGPGLSGKTTNLEQLAHLLAAERVGDLMSLDTTGDRTLFFDWMPVELGKIKGFDVKIQLFTVPGQVRYNHTRKQVLTGVDGVVFVADSQEEAVEQNRYSFANLRENLAEQAIDLEDVPLVIQWNKRDMPTARPTSELAARLNLEGYPQVEAVAAKGTGVRETLRAIAQVTLVQVKAVLEGAPPPTPTERLEAAFDGNALLQQLMAKDAGSGVDPDVTIEESATSSDDGEMLLGSDTGEHAAVGQQARQLERTVQALAREVRELQGGLTARVTMAVEREVEPTVAKTADLESRLGIVQRVVSRLSTRVEALERRTARLELAGGRQMSGDFKDLASHLEHLAKAFALFARRLSEPQPAQSASSPVAPAPPARE
jgi:hypothetical protein